MNEIEAQPEAESFPEVLRDLEGHINPDKTIDCSQEQPNSYWLELVDGDDRVEGKLHLAPKGLEKMVIFVPGLPGATVGRFEEEFVPLLIHDGYSVFVARHNGTRVDTAETENLVHSPKRKGISDIPLGLADSASVSRIDDMVAEPRVALNVFGSLNQVHEINIVSHSFGSLSTGVSLAECMQNNPKGAAKVSKWITVAGMTGELKDDGTFDSGLGFSLRGEEAEAVYESSFSPERYRVEGFEEGRAAIERAFRRLNSSTKELRRVNIIAVHNPEDPFVSLLSAQEMVNRVGRGIILKDKTLSQAKAIERGLGSVHDLPSADPKNLIRILKLRHIPRYPKEFSLKKEKGEK